MRTPEMQALVDGFISDLSEVVREMVRVEIQEILGAVLDQPLATVKPKRRSRKSDLPPVDAVVAPVSDRVKAVLEALRVSGGNISEASRQTGMSRSTIRRYSLSASA